MRRKHRRIWCKRCSHIGPPCRSSMGLISPGAAGCGVIVGYGDDVCEACYCHEWTELALHA